MKKRFEETIDYIGATADELYNNGFRITEEDFDGEETDIWSNGILEVAVYENKCIWVF